MMLNGNMGQDCVARKKRQKDMKARPGNSAGLLRCCKWGLNLVEDRLADFVNLPSTGCIVLTPTSRTHSETWATVRWGW